jgi:hypothetical protein
MDDLNLPAFGHKLKEIGGKPYIFDLIRRKYVRLTPEEWVRQHVVHLLIGHYQYPRSLIRTEVSLTLFETQKRADIVVFDRAMQPFLLVECKAPQVILAQTVFDQVARYNHVHRAPFFVVTNGLTHYCCAVDHATQTVDFLDDFPVF